MTAIRKITLRAGQPPDYEVGGPYREAISETRTAAFGTVTWIDAANGGYTVHSSRGDSLFLAAHYVAEALP